MDLGVSVRYVMCLTLTLSILFKFFHVFGGSLEGHVPIPMPICVRYGGRTRT